MRAKGRTPYDQLLVRADEVANEVIYVRCWPIELDQRQHHQMRGHAKSEFENAPVSYNGFAISKINLNVVVFEEYLIERVDGLVHGLLSCEEESPVVEIVANSELLLRSCDQFQQFRRKQFGRFDVYSHRRDVATQSDSRNGDTVIVCE